jgi:hypothetical protein
VRRQQRVDLHRHDAGDAYAANDTMNVAVTSSSCGATSAAMWAQIIYMRAERGLLGAKSRSC